MSFNYNISLSGLNAARYALKVTQNNIANVNTEGYARQRVSLTASGTLLGGGVESQIGSGVYAEKIERIKDSLLIEQVRGHGTRVSYFQSLQDGMSNIESILGELQKGSLTDTMQNFFNSWEEVSKYPSETSYREQVIGNAQQLAFKLNAVSGDLKTYKSELDNKIKVDMKKANDLIAQIARVNEEIKRAPTKEPNALLDKRDYYLDELAKIGNVRSITNSEDPNLIDIEFGGMMVVSGTKSQEMEGLYNESQDRWVFAVGNVPVRLENGSLLGNMKIRNETIPSHQKKLDEVASVIISEVNNLHKNAFALDGSTGHDFFKGTNASTISINSALQDNADLVSISSVAGQKGNSDIARQLADLQNKPTMSSGKNVVEDWSGFVVSAGQQLNSVNDNVSVYEGVWNDLKAQKQSVQGVDIDEEMSKLLQFEKFYQSNAKVLKTIDKVFEDLLNMV